MRSKVFFFLSFALVVFGGYKMVQDKVAMPAMLFNTIYFALSMVFYWLGIRFKFQEDLSAREKEWAIERAKEDENLEIIKKNLSEAGYKLRGKRQLAMLNSEDDGWVIELTTKDGVKETYTCSELVSEPVPDSNWRVYKNEIVAFVFFETVKTNGFYYIKARS